MKAFIDSDVLIWHLRGEKKALLFLEQLGGAPETDLWIGAMQRAEVVFFMRPSEEKSTLAFLSQFKTAAVDQHIIDRAGTLYRHWHPKCGMDVNDAILAATVLSEGGKLFSLKAKHYPMPDLLVERAW